MNGHLGKQHSSVTLELRCRFASGPHVLVGVPFMAPDQEGVMNHAPTVRSLGALHLTHS